MPFVEINVKNEIEKQNRMIRNLERHGKIRVPSIDS